MTLGASILPQGIATMKSRREPLKGPLEIAGTRNGNTEGENLPALDRLITRH